MRTSSTADDLFSALRGIGSDPSEPTSALPAAPLLPSPVQVSSEEGPTGVVRFGDTLERISERYDLSVDQLMRLNPELRRSPLVVGSPLRIDPAKPASRIHSLISLRPGTSGGVSWPDTPNYEPGDPSPSGGTRWLWPARGVFTSGYGWRWGRMHKGIDIANSVGSPILAAQSGRVTFAGWSDGGYGYLVEISHDDGSRSLYAHQSRIMVQVGEEVSQGQQIGQMGSTGRSTGPHLHFEIHAPGLGAVNPIQLLGPSA